MKHQRLRARIGGLLSAVLIAGCSVVGGKAADEPDYSVTEAEGAFEIREYPSLAVARTRVEAEDRSQAVSTGFRRLFDYITGANEGAGGSEKIAMTAPVLTRPSAEGAKIDMTAPVLQSETPGGWETVFVLPADMTAETAPRPTDPTVEIATIPARRVGVVTFSGILAGPEIEIQRQRLDEWLSARGLAHRGDWQAAGYNPPWTIPAYRRNEVLVTLE